MRNCITVSLRTAEKARCVPESRQRAADDASVKFL